MEVINLGAIERRPDPREILLGSVQAPITIPASYIPDISWLVRNYQGETSFCGEHAGTHLKAILDHQTGAVERKTPRYGVIKLKDPASPLRDPYAIDAGTDMPSIFKWLQKAGAADFEPLENPVTDPDAVYCDPSLVTPDIDANAAQSKISSYAFCEANYESICQAIYQNKAVILLIKCDSGFWHTKNPTFTTPEYGHFITAYAYDENGIYIVDSADPDDTNAFKFIAKEYITPTFFYEAGTAIDLSPSVKAIAIHPTLTPEEKTSIIQQILTDISQAVSLIKQEV